MKWTSDPNDKPGPIQVNRANKALNDLDMEHHRKLTKSGIIGKTEGFDRESEYVSTSFMVCGDNPKRADVSAAQARLHQKYNSTVSRKNINDLIADIALEMVALAATRPVEDKRETQAARDQRVSQQSADSQRRDEERNTKTAAEHALFIAHYGVSAETVTVPEGMMPITISLKFDNSDSMTDYFDRHAQLGPDFLLGYVPKQAQTQSVVRRLLERYPEFAKIGQTTDAAGKIVDGFHWKTENYSMGHGNYLDGSSFELPADLQGLQKRYGGGKVTNARWQVEFNSTGRFGTDKYLPLKGYPGVNAGLTATKSNHAEGVMAGAAATVTLNAALNGVEIRFPGKPDASVISSLKANGFRWAFRGKCWYKRQSPAAIAFANGLAGVVPATPANGGASVPASHDPGPDHFDMQVEDNMAAACGC